MKNDVMENGTTDEYEPIAQVENGGSGSEAVESSKSNRTETTQKATSCARSIPTDEENSGDDFDTDSIGDWAEYTENNEWDLNLVPRTGYAKTLMTGASHLSETQFAQELSKHNDHRVLPEFCIKIKDGYRLIFRDKQTKEEVVKKGLKIQGEVIQVERPREEVPLIKTVYMYNIPIVAPHQAIKSWLEKKTGGKLKEGTEVKYVQHKGTEILSSARSAVLELPRNAKEIPGFLALNAPNDKVLFIRMHYKGMADWCRGCGAKGHRSFSCPRKEVDYRHKKTGPWDTQNVWKKPQYAPDSHPPAVEENTTSAESSTSTYAQKAVKPTQSTMQLFPDYVSMGVAKNQLFEEGMRRDPELDRKYRNNLKGFFTKKMVFSNHYPAKFTVGEVEYESVEHYLFTQKAVESGDVLREKMIQDNKRDPVQVKRIGDCIVYPKGDREWLLRAMNLLEEGNRAKYIQNEECMDELVKSEGFRLVECSRDKWWGCGYFIDEQEQWSKLDNWQGLNVFGDILTKLRDEFLSDNTEEMIRSKRKYEQSSGSVSPLPKKSVDDQMDSGDMDFEVNVIVHESNG